jgi:glycosyltransferase involved in cell wall biosynthesis
MTTEPSTKAVPSPQVGRCEAGCAFTVFVPSYNRAYCLARALDSIAESTCQDLEIIVVDDGSTDDTKAVVEAWRSNHPQPLSYLYQDNAGKHAAHNNAVAHAQGFMFITLDSDDSLLPGALAAVQRYWAAIPEVERGGFAGIGGLVQEEDGSISGTEYPAAVVDSDYLEIDALGHVHGDKREALRTQVLREFPYPVFPGENHLRPSLILRRIGHRYRTRFINVPLVLGRREADGISNNRRRYRMRNPQGLRLAFLEEINLHDHHTNSKQLHRNHVRYVRFSLSSGVGLLRQAREVKHPWYWLAALPEGLGSWLGDRLSVLVRRRDG